VVAVRPAATAAQPQRPGGAVEHDRYQRGCEDLWHTASIDRGSRRVNEKLSGC
jgi:hypothetical protein